MRAVTAKSIKSCIRRRINFSKEAIGRRATQCHKNGKFSELDWKWLDSASNFYSSTNRKGEKFEVWLSDVMRVREEYPEDLKSLIRIASGLEEVLMMISLFEDDKEIYFSKGSEEYIEQAVSTKVMVKNTEGMLVRHMERGKAFYVLSLTSIVV